MITAFSLLCQRCGLSNREAAAFVNVRIDTAKSWASGRNRTPDGVIAALRGLAARQENAASQALAQINEATTAHGQPDVVEIGWCADDYEAQLLGFPCVGAHAAVLGIILARHNGPVLLVPRGSTPGTAAAADAHRR